MRKAQARYLEQLLVQKPWVRKVAEVGFNAGHSSYLFLKSRPDVEVTSFDLGDHDYTHLAKWIIDEHFPGRHSLVIGDSGVTVPAFAKSQPDHKFDLIFIDGGHDFDVAVADIDNCRLLATDQTIVIMDDLNPHDHWSAGPVRAWLDAQRDCLIAQDVLIENGVTVVNSVVRQEEASCMWALGHYLRCG